jgi:hypothetical protein
VMDELSESTHRRTPSFPHPGAQSPRVGSCVGKFYQLFDWSLSKRVSSTKRIIAGTYSSFVNSASSVHPLLNTITAMAINRELLSSGSVAVRQILVLERMPSFECILIVHNIKISEREATA